MEQSHDVRLKDNSSAAVTNDVDQCLNAFDRHLESERGWAPPVRGRITCMKRGAFWSMFFLI